MCLNPIYKPENTTKPEHYQIFNNPIPKIFSSQPNIYFIAKFRVLFLYQKLWKWFEVGRAVNYNNAISTKAEEKVY